MDEPHHDGSPLYVSSIPHTLDSTVRLRLRVPDTCSTERVRLRSTPDAEPSVVEALIERREHGAGIFHCEVTDDADFRISTAAPPPGWLAGTIGYQIFIDRFANSGTPRESPAWAIPRAWHEPVEDTPDIRTRHWYGGDLPGIEQRLDHLVHLGVNLVYLTPFFPAGSMHRYDGSTFDHVDPALGGDDALASLVSAARERNIRVIGDITLNHTGVHHDWFAKASADPGRVDCANTTARFGDHDANHDVAHLTRSTMNAEDWLVAEHCYDSGDDLDGTGWHGVMAYQWFTRPVWAWLKDSRPLSLMSAVELIDLDGYGFVESMRHLSANVS